MDLKELLKTTPWQDIAIALVTAYPNQRKLLEGYQIVFETLKLMAPKDSDLTLHVVYDDSDSEDGGHDVYGTKADKPDERWGLLFVPWAEWLGMELAPETVSTNFFHCFTHSIPIILSAASANLEISASWRG